MRKSAQTTKKSATKSAPKSAPKRSRPTKAKAPAKRSSTRKVTRGEGPGSRTDAVGVLRADHVVIRSLLAQLKGADTQAQRDKMLERVEQHLKAHTTVEEEIFYPAFRDAARNKEDRQLFFEAKEEHHAADVVLAEVGRVRTKADEFSARAKVLKELVEHHAEEEEKEMFPQAKRLPDEVLESLLIEMEALRNDLEDKDVE